MLVFQGGTTPVFNAPVRVSFVRLPNTEICSSQLDENGELIEPTEGTCTLERICFNIGRELFVYDFQ
jgi:hypothetical protein